METTYEKKPVFDRSVYKSQYENFIGGQWVGPSDGQYFENHSPIDGSFICKVARSQQADIDRALDAAHVAFPGWSKTTVIERSIILNKIADQMEENLQFLAQTDTIDKGKPIRESAMADLPLAIDMFRYFAGVIRGEEGSMSELNPEVVSLNVQEPIGVVGQIIPWNFPILMYSLKVAPALAAGCCTVLKPAEQTPLSAMVLTELIQDLLPAGVLNVVNGYGEEAGKALASSPKVDKIAFTGESTTGKLIMQYAAENLTPVSLELGGKGPNIFLPSILDKEDEFLEKAVEGAVMFAFNQGEVCLSPARLLVHESIAERFIERVIQSTKNIKVGNPLEMTTAMGSQASKEQYDKILSYFDVAKQEGAEILTGGHAMSINDGLQDGYYIEPTVLKGNNKMRVFQEEIFGPVVSYTTYKDAEDAIAIANDTMYGLAAGVWTRDAHEMYTIPRAIQAGTVWVNCYYSLHAHAPFGGYKKSGFGREGHKMVLNHYRKNKNMLISNGKNKLGFY